MFNLIISSFLATVQAVVLQTMPPKLETIHIAKASSFNEAVLSAEKQSPIIASDVFEGENVAEDEEDIKTTPEGIAGLIKEEFGAEWEVMLRVAQCESGLRHYVKGGVLRGEQVKEDVGLFQINETYWLEKSKKLGIDIYDLEGNVKIARHIYDTQGLSAWSASFKCWRNI